MLLISQSKLYSSSYDCTVRVTDLCTGTSSEVIDADRFDDQEPLVHNVDFTQDGNEIWGKSQRSFLIPFRWSSQGADPAYPPPASLRQQRRNHLPGSSGTDGDDSSLAGREVQDWLHLAQPRRPLHCRHCSPKA